MDESKLIAEGEFIIPADNAVIKSGDIKVINIDANINTIDKKLFPSEFIPLSPENILPALKEVKTALEITVIKANGKKEMIKKENIDPIILKFNRYLNI